MKIRLPSRHTSSATRFGFVASTAFTQRAQGRIGQAHLRALLQGHVPHDPEAQARARLASGRLAAH